MVGRTPLKNLRPKIATVDLRTARPAPKQADPHYASAEHLAWRRAVLERAGWQCEWPGCGRSNCRLFADHIVELRDGGAALDVANGQALCGAHHTLKTAESRRRRGETL